jgi:hypothetical protein
MDIMADRIILSKENPNPTLNPKILPGSLMKHTGCFKRYNSGIFIVVWLFLFQRSGKIGAFQVKITINSSVGFYLSIFDP